MIRNEGRSVQPAHATDSAWSPGHLSFACLVNGVEPMPLDRPFTYFELGFGQEPLEGHKFAACAPHGRFYAAGCRAVPQDADTAVSNLTLLAHSVAELAQGAAGLPRFDFIALRCEYDRIPVESRRHVVAFMARHLKPGGIVYSRYNAMPGGSTGHPLQQLVLEYEACHAQAEGEEALSAQDFVQALADSGGKYFVANPGLQACWERLKEQPVHGLSRREPLYFADVARDFAAAKLDFAGAADPRLAFPDRYLTKEQQSLLSTVADMVLRETLKDTICNTAYRSDVFVRGARRMHPLRQNQWLERCGLVLTESADTFVPAAESAEGQVDIAGTVFHALLDAPARRAPTLAELKELPAFRGENLSTLLEAAARLVAAGYAAPFFANSGPDIVPRQDRTSPNNTEKRKASELE